MEIWENIGVVGEAMDAGTWLHGQTVFVNGRQTHQVDWDLPEVPYAHLGLPQYETERILTGCLERHGGRVERGVRAARLHPGRRRCHRPRCTSVGGQTAQVRARYLVGCDGAHSTVRQAIGADLRGRHGHVPAAVHARRRRPGLDDARGPPAALHPGRGRGDEGHAGLRAAARAAAATGWRRWRRRGCRPRSARARSRPVSRRSTRRRRSPTSRPCSTSWHRPGRPRATCAGRRSSGSSTASWTATATAGCSWPATPRTCTRPRAARA